MNTGIEDFSTRKDEQHAMGRISKSPESANLVKRVLEQELGGGSRFTEYV